MTTRIEIPEPAGAPTRIDDYRHELKSGLCEKRGHRSDFGPDWRCRHCGEEMVFSHGLDRSEETWSYRMIRWGIELEAAKKRFLADPNATVDMLLIHGNVATELADFVIRHRKRFEAKTFIFIGGYVETATPGLRIPGYEKDLSEQAWLSLKLGKAEVRNCFELPHSRHSMDEVRHFYTEGTAQPASTIGFVGTAPQMARYTLCHRTVIKKLKLKGVKLTPFPVETGCPFGDDLAQLHFELQRIEERSWKGWIIAPEPFEPILGINNE